MTAQETRRSLLESIAPRLSPAVYQEIYDRIEKTTPGPASSALPVRIARPARLAVRPGTTPVPLPEQYFTLKKNFNES